VELVAHADSPHQRAPEPCQLRLAASIRPSRAQQQIARGVRLVYRIGRAAAIGVHLNDQAAMRIDDLVMARASAKAEQGCARASPQPCAHRAIQSSHGQRPASILYRQAGAARPARSA